MRPEIRICLTDIVGRRSANVPTGPLVLVGALAARRAVGV
jgi:hypothetical protein